MTRYLVTEYAAPTSRRTLTPRARIDAALTVKDRRGVTISVTTADHMWRADRVDDVGTTWTLTHIPTGRTLGGYGKHLHALADVAAGIAGEKMDMYGMPPARRRVLTCGGS